MSMRRSLSIAAHETRVILTDWSALVTLLLTPIVLMAFIEPLARSALSENYEDVDGSEFSVPAMAVLFSFFLVSFVGFRFFSEHHHNTWERLRASPASTSEIVVGKIIPGFGLCLFQQTFLFGTGFALFGLRTEGSLVAIALVAIALALCWSSMGVLLAAFLPNEQQLSALANLGAIVLGGISGALVPVNLLPGWAQVIAPIAPQYWAMRGFTAVFLDDAGVGSAILPCAVLLGLTAMMAAIAITRFRFDEPNVERVRDRAMADRGRANTPVPVVVGTFSDHATDAPDTGDSF